MKKHLAVILFRILMTLVATPFVVAGWYAIHHGSSSGFDLAISLWIAAVAWVVYWWRVPA